MAGLDIYNAVGSYLNQDLSTSGEVSSTISDRIAEGKLGMKTGSGLYDYTPEDIDRSAGRAGGEARRRAQGSRGGAGGSMKVWLLDNGSIVIEHTQFMWNVPGPQVRIPVVRRARRARRRALPLRHRLRPRAHERRAAFRAPRADPGADDPRAARARRLLDVRRDDARQLPPPLRPRRRQQALLGHPECRARAGARAGARPRAVRVLRLLGQDVGPRRRAVRDRVGGRRAREGPVAVRDARPHDRALLPARQRRLGGERRCCSRSTSSTRARRWSGVSSPGSTSTRGRACARSSASRTSPPSTARTSSSRTIPRHSQAYKHAPDYYEL